MSCRRENLDTRTDYLGQGGSYDPWGGYGFEQCGQLINHEQVRVFYKNMFASGVTIFSLYMVCHSQNMFHNPII